MIGWLFAALVSVLPVDYVLVAQRPDDGGALHVPYTADFAACCTAYSASTINFYHPTPRVIWVHFSVYLTAHTSEDAVRLRIIDATTGATHTLDELRPNVLGAPRPLGLWLPVDAWNARETEHAYVLETRGRPTIYGAKLRVGYEGGL